MYIKRIGDKLSFDNRCSGGNCHVIRSGTDTIQRSIAVKEPEFSKPLCEYYKKADTNTKSNGKISDSRWLFYEAPVDFIAPLLKEGLHIITKMRPDADLRYTYNGTKQAKRGRRKLYDGKVDCTSIDQRRIKNFDEDDEVIYYSGIVYCKTLKQLVRIVYLQHKVTKRYEIFLCTDTLIEPALIIKYYRLRFQIEFLIRDAKQHCGLEECQARSENKLYFHFNMALSAVSVAKAGLWLSLPKEKREAFSMRNIKLMYYNKTITERIFSNLALDLNCKKIKRLYNQCLSIGALAA
jgi:hypothetical protein